ncbi:histidine phosphatase family protein [Haloactinopolyspora sp.]|uniref:histidine phosphatase family protein n=1 Tax=Haloactinopolyspora sp. TaxID=1966353 RepID=UPI00260B6821|nr:histidine phosphatase family protein [Haloactinopolyspora sp.]
MTPAVLWLRHGTCDDGLCRPGAHARPHSGLTIGGTVEAELAADQLRVRAWRPSLTVSSPLRRARQTAVLVAARLHSRLAEPIATFIEWRAPRCVLGLTASQYPPEYLAWRGQRAANPDSALPGGESLHAFAERAREAAAIADHLATEHGTVLIVSHRLLIGAVAAHHHGHRRPADVFRRATDFQLAPGRPWTAPIEETT